MTRNRILFPVLLAVLLAGCAQTGKQPQDTAAAEVEDREPPPRDGEADAAAAGRGGDIDGRAVTTVDVEGGEQGMVAAAVPAQRVIFFDYDASSVRPDFYPLIESHAAFLKERPETKVRLEGHTDERGSREYNVALGEGRAAAVRQLLLFYGVSDTQITIVSYGEERPSAFGHNEDGWRLNRRVELHY